MQKVGATLLARLRKIFDPSDPAPVRKPLDLYEFYAHDYQPPAGQSFDPTFAVQRFASQDFVWGGHVYLKKVVSRGPVQKVRGQQSNSLTVNFSNVDEDHYLAAWAQATQIEGMWLVVRYVERDIAGDSAILFAGKAGKPSTIDNDAFTLEATTRVGNQNQRVPKRRFVSEDPLGRDPSDPEFEGIRFLATGVSFQYSQIIPAQHALARFFGQRDTIRVSRQESSVDGTPYGDPRPEILGRCKIKLIPFLWLDHGPHVGYNMAACDGPIKSITSLKTITQGFSDPINSVAVPPAPPEIHLGDKGGTGTNAAGWIQFPAAGVFSYLAGISAASTGSKIDVTDGPPEVVAVVMGRIVPLRDAAGVYNQLGWTDNPVDLVRWYYNYLIGVPLGLIEDAANAREAEFCDFPLLDTSNGERIFIPSADISAGGVERFRSTGVLDSRLVRIYSLGEVLPEDPPTTPVDPEPWNPGNPLDPVGDPPVIPYNYVTQALLRKRYTLNVPIRDFIEARDFLYKTIYPAFRGYDLMNASGRLEVRVEKAADNGLLRNSIAAGAVAIPLDDVRKWKRDFWGRIILGSPKLTAEARLPTSVDYTAAANGITLAAIGTGIAATASGATLTGGSAAAQASGTITLSGAAGAGGTVTVTINGISVTYILDANDTLSSAALMVVASIRANTRLNRFIEASAVGAVVTVKSKWGVINVPALAYAHDGPVAPPAVAPVLSSGVGTMKAGTYLVGYSWENVNGETTLSPLSSITLTDNHAVHVAALGALPAGVTKAKVYMSEAPNSSVVLYATDSDGSAGFTMNGLPSKNNSPEPPYNTTAEECLRIAMSFSTNLQGAAILAQAGLTRANAQDYNFPLGSEQTSVNQVKGQFTDSKNDFALVPITVNDYAHQALIGQENPLDLDLSAVDNWHQGSRLCNGALAKNRDGDWFNSLKTGDGEALLLEEDDLNAASDASGGHVNVVTRIEALSISPNWQVTITKARRYSTLMYRDDVRQHEIPLPSTLRYTTAAPTPLSVVSLTQEARVAPDGTYVASIRGDVTFEGFLMRQHGRVWWRKPEDEKAVTTDATSNTFTSSGHGLQNGAPVSFRSVGGLLPAPLITYLNYYVINATTNTFQIASTLGGPAIDLTSAGTGAVKVGEFKFSGTLIDPDKETLDGLFFLDNVKIGHHEIKIVAESASGAAAPFETHGIYGIDVSVRPSVLRVAEPVLVRSSDKGLGFLVGIFAAAGTAPWIGADLWRDRLLGSGYEKAASITTPATGGVTTNTLAPVSDTTVFDSVSTVRVNFDGGSVPPASCTQEESLAGRNKAVIGNTNGYEAITFTTAVPVAGSTYDISGFWRGRDGTEFAVGAHGIGDVFLLVNEALKFIPCLRSDIGQPQNLKGVSFGESITGVAAQAFTLIGNSQKPLAIARVDTDPSTQLAPRDSAGSILVSAWPRTNFDVIGDTYLVEFLSDDRSTVIHSIQFEEGKEMAALLISFVTASGGKFGSINQNTLTATGLNTSVSGVSLQRIRRTDNRVAATLKSQGDGSAAVGLISAAKDWRSVTADFQIFTVSGLVAGLYIREPGNAFNVFVDDYTGGDVRVEITLSGTEVRFYRIDAVKSRKLVYVSTAPVSYPLTAWVSAATGSSGGGGGTAQVDKVVITTDPFPATIFSAAQQQRFYAGLKNPVQVRLRQYSGIQEVGYGFPFNGAI